MTAGTAVADLHHVATFPALGTTATLVVTDPGAAGTALPILRHDLERLDEACSRFRDDSELVRLNARAGRGPVPVSPLLAEAIEAALWACDVTGGLVDPTVGSALELVGYDRDFDRIPSDGPALDFVARPVPGRVAVTFDRAAGTVSLRRGTRLDLGATAKALCADRAAAHIAASTGSGVLVSLGGDISVAGPIPDAGWPVRIDQGGGARDGGSPLDGPGPTVVIRDGGLATSSTTVRTWRRGGRLVHHVVDPSSSLPAPAHWETVTVAAGSCLGANAASCAAIVMGPGAPDWLGSRGLPGRLVRAGGDVERVGGWPADEVPACC